MDKYRKIGSDKSMAILFCLLAILLAGCMRMPVEPQKNSTPSIPLIVLSSENNPEGSALIVSAEASDPDNDALSYQISVETIDGSTHNTGVTNWTPFVDSGVAKNFRFYFRAGTYMAKVRCKDDRHSTSAYSNTYSISLPDTPPRIVYFTSVDTMLNTLFLSVKADMACDEDTMVKVDYGDGNFSDWLPVDFNYMNDNNIANHLYTYAQAGTYQLRAKTRYADQTTTRWSAPIDINIP